MCLGFFVCFFCVDIMRSGILLGVDVFLYCVDIMRYCDVFGGYCLFGL
jgi:hypothetical protein